MTRAERAAEAARLKSEGLNGIQIAERMGVSRSYAYELLADPEGVGIRARKASYRGTCMDCGGWTHGSNGRSGAPKRCAGCHKRHIHWEAVLRIIAAIRRFHERYGRVPSATDFNPNQARSLGHEWRAERFEQDGDYPWTFHVLCVFGTWNAAVTAAGFEPRPVGHYSRNGRAGAHLAAERAAA